MSDFDEQITASVLSIGDVLGENDKSIEKKQTAKIEPSPSILEQDQKCCEIDNKDELWETARANLIARGCPEKIADQSKYLIPHEIEQIKKRRKLI